MSVSRKLKTALALGGITGAVTFSLLLHGQHRLLNAQYESLGEEHQLLNDQFDNHKVISKETIRNLLGQVANLKSLIVGKNKSLEQFKGDLSNAKETIANLQRELEIEKRISDVLSTSLEQEKDRVKALEEEIKNLDETVEEFADEIVEVRKASTKLTEEYQAALKAVFELDKAKKDLETIVKQANERISVLQSYQSFYEKNLVSLNSETCIIQLQKFDDEDSSEDKPYMECDASFMRDGKKYDGRVTIEPRSNSDNSWNYLLGEYNKQTSQK